MRSVKRTALVCVACLMAAAGAAAQSVTAGVKGGFALNSIPNAGQVIDQISGVESVDVSAKPDWRAAASCSSLSTNSSHSSPRCCSS